MKVALIGSRGLIVTDLEKYLPPNTTEIVSGGARGLDISAEEYSAANSIKLTKFLPDYDKYGNAAPLIRNFNIIAYSERVLAFWDGKSHGTKFLIEHCNKIGIPVEVFILRPVLERS